MIKGTDLTELALIVYNALKKEGIQAVLSGGGAVTIYTNNEYESRDLDFISSDDHKKIAVAMKSLGFSPSGRNFSHPDTEFTVEFPTGPLSVGSEVLKIPPETTVRGKKLRLLTPIDSIKDRLSGFYHWNVDKI